MHKIHFSADAWPFFLLFPISVDSLWVTMSPIISGKSHRHWLFVSLAPSGEQYPLPRLRQVLYTAFSTHRSNNNQSIFLKKFFRISSFPSLLNREMLVLGSVIMGMHHLVPHFGSQLCWSFSAPWQACNGHKDGHFWSFTFGMTWVFTSKLPSSMLLPFCKSLVGQFLYCQRPLTLFGGFESKLKSLMGAGRSKRVFITGSSLLELVGVVFSRHWWTMPLYLLEVCFHTSYNILFFGVRGDQTAML